MSRKAFLVLVAIVALAGIAGYLMGWFGKAAPASTETEVVTTSSTAEQAAPDEEAVEPGGKMKPYAWTFTTLGEDEGTGAPRVQVRVTDNVTGRTYDAGTSLGGCFVAEDTPWGLIDGAESAAICYFAGGGDEYGIFRDGDQVLLRKGTVEEGTAETEGMRGDFQTVTAIR